MKSCPACNRTYADDAQVFCLEDGAQLSAPFIPAAPRDPQATLRIPGARDTDPPTTEVLPLGFHPEALPAPSPAAGAGGAPPPTLAVAAPRGAPADAWPGQAPAKSGGKSWMVVSGVLALVAIGLVAVLGYVMLSGNRGIGSSPIANNNNVTRNNNLPANRNGNDPGGSTTNTSSDPKGDGGENAAWLEGVWNGQGSQLDGTTFTVAFGALDSKYSIDYPSLHCGGHWDLNSKTGSAATFTEVITYGKNCVSGGKIAVTRSGEQELSCKWTYAGTDVEVASATLKKHIETPR